MASLLRSGCRGFASIAKTSTAKIPSVRTIHPTVMACLREMKDRKYTNEDYKKPLEPRTSADSAVQFVIPLSNDVKMQQIYLSAQGHVRMGKVLEDLDHTAAYLTLSHNREDKTKKGIGVGSLPRIALTAAVEHLDFFKHELNLSQDIIIEGKVAFTGRTTVETALRAFQRRDDSENVQQLIRANFIMAARCPATLKSVPVHPLIAANTKESAEINNAVELVKERKKAKQLGLDVTNPSHEEFCQLHYNFLQAVRKRQQNMHELTLLPSQVWQHETICTTMVNCHPIHQNFYGKVFGGFIMREASELAHLTAKLFCKGRVHDVSMDDVSFLKGIEIGSIVKFTSTVVYSLGKWIQVRVMAEVVEKDTFERHISTVFHFTHMAANEQFVKEVVPKHYEHGVLWLEGRRQLEKTLGKARFH